MTRAAAILAIPLMIGVSCGRKQEAPRFVSPTEEGEKVEANREQPLSPSAPAISVRVIPEFARTGTRLQLIVTGIPLEEKEIDWMVDGEPAAGEHEDTFSTEGRRKGTSIQARVNFGEREISSNAVTLMNSPPVIRSVRIVPETIRPGDSIGVEVTGEDPDGDEVTFRMDWEKNGRPAGTESKMEGTLHRGDAFSVRITPFDGESAGDFLVVRREVNNYPPSIEGVFDARLSDGVYTCEIVATDGDDDPLTYALVEAPPGMRIDPGKGTIRWAVPDRFFGRVPVAVSVVDGHGGEASYPWTLDIQGESSGE